MSHPDYGVLWSDETDITIEKGSKPCCTYLAVWMPPLCDESTTSFLEWEGGVYLARSSAVSCV